MLLFIITIYYYRLIEKFYHLVTFLLIYSYKKEPQVIKIALLTLDFKIYKKYNTNWSPFRPIAIFCYDIYFISKKNLKLSWYKIEDKFLSLNFIKRKYNTTNKDLLMSIYVLTWFLFD